MKLLLYATIFGGGACYLVIVTTKVEVRCGEKGGAGPGSQAALIGLGRAQLRRGREREE